ncbi:RecE family exodeoxyribonuclease [Hafnia alvei]|uniref:RecE family exodeoxyribonuclease n=1 Tax=Hafnia alvei TaxID=569 RepID=UPI0028BD21A3|nr:RecE family exodeoxyribonuclease [Hafnia alvei]WNN50718.1 RecE family exodeoxyribonuclease [Hafnia alvei]
MTIYFNFLGAKKSSNAKDAVILVDVETAKECPFAISFLAKKNSIDLSNYFKPVTTDTPIVDDLPVENEFCTTWCDKYELADDKKTWRLIATEEASQPDVELINISSRPLDFRFSSLWLFGPETETITREEMKDVINMIADTANNFAQNILLCVRGEQFAKNATLAQLGALVQATKEAFVYTDRPAEIGTISNFFKQYCSCAVSEAGEDALANIVKLYSDKQTTPVMPETKAQTTSTGATLGTPIRLSDDVLHSPIFLKKIIAYAMQPANGYDLLAPPKGIIDRAAELMTDQDVIDWYNALSETPGILALHPDFTFASIQAAPFAITSDKKKLREYISHNLGVIQPVPVKTEEIASNDGEKTEVGTTDKAININYKTIRAAVCTVLNGETTVISNSKVDAFLEAINITKIPLGRMLAKEIASFDTDRQLTDDDVHHLVADVLENWNDDKGPRLEFIESLVVYYIADHQPSDALNVVTKNEVAPTDEGKMEHKTVFSLDERLAGPDEKAQIAECDKSAKPPEMTIEELQAEIQALKGHQQLLSNFVSAGVKFLLACDGDK